MLLFLLSSCARMGNPDGGWYDETPPHVVGASPADKAVNVKEQKVRIVFDEFIIGGKSVSDPLLYRKRRFFNFYRFELVAGHVFYSRACEVLV